MKAEDFLEYIRQPKSNSKNTKKCLNQTTAMVTERETMTTEENKVLLEVSLEEFCKLIDPTIRNLIQNQTKKYKRKIGNKCERCGQEKELQSAHRHADGNNRKDIIRKVLKNHIENDLIRINNLDELKEEVFKAHLPIEEHFIFLCEECHRKYDKSVD